MGSRNIFRQQKGIDRLRGNSLNRGYSQTRRNPDSEGAMTSRKTPVHSTPSIEKGAIERGQGAGVKGIGPRKNIQSRRTKTIQKIKVQKMDPRGRAGNEMPGPLHLECPNFEPNGNNRKSTEKGRLTNNSLRYQVPFTFPKKCKDQGILIHFSPT